LDNSFALQPPSTSLAKSIA
jgi:hypothetical protein